MTKTICHLTSVHQYNDTRIFHKECVSLARYGYPTYLISLGCETKKVDGVNVISSGPKFSSKFKRMTQGVYSVYKKAIEINADVYHFHDPELLFVGWLLKQKGKKVIYDVHEDVPRQILSKPWIWKPIQTSVSIGTEKIENFIASKLSGIITATSTIANRFSQINKNTIAINNYPLLEELQTNTIWENKKNEICYIGGISIVRGIVELNKAIAFNTTIKLNLVGNFQPPSLAKELEPHLFWKQINYLGFVDRKKIAEILAVSKVGMVTLHPIINYLDAHPIKMFEYMSAGIPVIASNFPLWKSIVEGNQCGICINPMNPKEIADAITYLLAHDKEAEQMGKNGRKAIEEKFNWEMEEQKLIAFYQNL